jgi:hypothetical protein
MTSIYPGDSEGMVNKGLMAYRPLQSVSEDNVYQEPKQSQNAGVLLKLFIVYGILFVCLVAGVPNWEI